MEGIIDKEAFDVSLSDRCLVHRLSFAKPAIR
jgi:hypothetical protein